MRTEQTKTTSQGGEVTPPQTAERPRRKRTENQLHDDLTVALGRSALKKLQNARDILRVTEEASDGRRTDERLTARKAEAQETVNRLTDAILSIPQRRESSLLYCHAVKDTSLTDLAVTMNVSLRTVYRLHQKALLYLGRQLTK